jgi:NAD(P)-dependent dehydrogenase (short-subunit alcohol dehydrogenase family)
MMLKDKVAVIYGAGGDVGGAVARAFAREGARLFLSGRSLRSVEAVAADVVGRSGVAEAAQVDALDEQAVEDYVGAVAVKAGAIDISFNAIGISRALPQRAPLLDLPAEQFALPIATYTRAHFLTARIAARRMVARRSGVILTIAGTPSRLAFPNVGGLAPAFAAVVALSRTLSAELAPQGVRVVCLMPNAMPETRTIRESFERYARATGLTQAEYRARLEGMTPRTADHAGGARERGRLHGFRPGQRDDGHRRQPERWNRRRVKGSATGPSGRRRRRAPGTRRGPRRVRSESER